MQATFQHTQKDFYEALIACRNRNVVRRWARRILLAIAVVMLGISLFLKAARPEFEAGTNIGVLVGLIVLWGIAFWGVVWWTARKQFTQQPSVRGPRTTTFDATGVHTRWDGGTGDVEWKSYLGYSESKTQSLLYTSPVMFGIIPKRCLDTQQLAELRSLLSLHIPVMK